MNQANSGKPGHTCSDSPDKQAGQGDASPPLSLGRRLLWFVLLWITGVGVLGLIGFLLRSVITSIYGS